MGQEAVERAAERIAVDNVQRLVRSGYDRLRFARFLLFTIDDPAAARAWLGRLELCHAAGKGPDTRAVNLALTFAGLQALGLDEAAQIGLSDELRDGMVTEHRRRLLGDHDDSDPEGWDWGGPRDRRPLHGALLLYARNDDTLEALCSEQSAAFAGALTELTRLETNALADRKEHFGFRDGMGQPVLLGLDERAPGWNSIAPGEMLLGYRNQYDKLPRSPHVVAPSPLLPGADGTPGRDFGRDGSYLVMRQLEQDVPGFWKSAAEKAAELRVEEVFPECGSGAVMLASKLIGRWPSGAPLVRAPHRDDDSLCEDDTFRYTAEDPDGLKCPFGSHIRRANPRDWFLDAEAETSTRVANRHRILRRGRAYGPALVQSMETEALRVAPEDGKSRGLHFLCLNANIGRQFELVQHSWINGPKFGGLYASADPLLGDSIPATSARPSAATFEIPAPPLRLRVRNMNRFVRTRGGAYFFLPSLRAVKYLASLSTPVRAP